MKKVLIVILVVVLLLLGGGFFYIYQYTDIIRSRLIPKINQITLEYAPGYNYEDALKKNEGETEFIKIQSLKLKENDIKSIKNSIKGIKEVSLKTKEFPTICELKIDKDTNLIVGEKNAKLIKGKKTTYVKTTKSLLNNINNIIDKNNEKVLEKLTYTNVTIKKDGAVINITNEDNKKIIQEAISYYRINQSDDYLSYDGGYKEQVILDDATKIYLYSSNIGYIKGQESFYVVFPNNLEEAVNSIYQVSIS